MEIKAFMFSSAVIALWQTAVPPEVGIISGAERLTLIGVLLLIVRELWARNKERDKIIDEDRSQMTKAFTENTLAIESMKEAIENLTESVAELKTARKAVEEFRTKDKK